MAQLENRHRRGIKDQKRFKELRISRDEYLFVPSLFKENSRLAKRVPFFGLYQHALVL